MGAGSKFCVSVEGVGGDMREGQMGGALGSCSGGSIASQSRHLAPGWLEPGLGLGLTPFQFGTLPSWTFAHLSTFVAHLHTWFLS